MNEIIVLNLVYFVAGIFIALSGIHIKQSKAYSLIPGYNTMSAERGKKVNIRMVAIAVRNASILLGILLIIIPIITQLFGINQVRTLLLIISHSVVIISLLIIIYTGRKYKSSN